MQLKTDTLQGTGYKFSLNYSQSIQKERQISKQNNTKSDTKDVYILEDSTWVRFLSTAGSFTENVPFGVKTLKMVLKGQRHSKKTNNKSKCSLA